MGKSKSADEEIVIEKYRDSGEKDFSPQSRWTTCTGKGMLNSSRMIHTKMLLGLVYLILLVVVLFKYLPSSTADSASRILILGKESRLNQPAPLGSDDSLFDFCDLGSLTTYSDLVKANMRCRRVKEERAVDVDPLSIPPFKHRGSIYRISKRPNLGTCVVPKVMSSILQNVFCYLYDSDNFIRNNRSIVHDKYENRLCGESNELSTLQQVRNRTSEEVPILFVARDPTQRFISAFMDKCVNEMPSDSVRCFGCRGNLSCVLHNFYDFMWLRITDKLSTKVLIEQHLFFTHASPQTWYCEMSQNYHHFHFVRYGSSGKEQQETMDEVLRFLRSHNVVEHKIEFIKSSLTDERTHHSTVGSKERKKVTKELLNSPRLLQLLYRIYKYDYEVFQFGSPLPQEGSRNNL